MHPINTNSIPLRAALAKLEEYEAQIQKLKEELEAEKEISK